MLIRDWIGFLLQVSAIHQQKLRLSPSPYFSLDQSDAKLNPIATSLAEFSRISGTFT